MKILNYYADNGPNWCGNYTFEIEASDTVDFNISGPNMTYYGSTGKHVSLNDSVYNFTVKLKGADYSKAWIKITFKYSNTELEGTESLDLNIKNLTYLTEPNPMDWDSDNDGLLDYGEPEWKTDTDYSPSLWADHKINVYDWDSNFNNAGDYDGVFVVFRTNANDSEGDGMLNYGPGTWIAVDHDGYTNLENFDTFNLYVYEYIENVTCPYPIPSTVIDVDYNGDIKTVKTPNKQSVYLSDLQSGEYQYAWVKISSTLYIKYGNPSNDPGTYNWRFFNRSSQPKSDDYSSPINFVFNHSETYDARVALNKDSDFDGISNVIEQIYGLDPHDQDTDDDGVMDGKEFRWNKHDDNDTFINARDPDSDNDGITDGTEMGITQPIPSTSLWDGTNTSRNMTGSLRKNFTADNDPSTTTNVTMNDTDGDGLLDGWDDWDANGGWTSGETKGEDENYDGNVDSDESDPLDYDSDDDGVPDGHAKEGTQDTDNDTKINAIDPDSDNDGLYDGIELGYTAAMITNYTDLDKGYFTADANPKSTTDPCDADSDKDGIKDGIEDKDKNGAIDGDLDKDNTWDEEETWFETSPNKLDSDGDGLNDGAEDIDKDGTVDSNETDPIKKDSDGDSLEDGDELNIYNCSPTKMDTDGDGLTDGQEVDGWDVAVYYQVSKEAKGDPWHVTSLPNIKDTDNDRLTDYEEFMNGSDPNNTDTDGDNIPDYEEFLDGDDENTPTAFDGKAPRLDKFSVIPIDKGWGQYRLQISIRARDQAGVDWVSVKVEGQRTKKVSLYGENEKTVSFEFNIDIGRSLGGGYDVYIKGQDINGNEGKCKKHIPGIMEAIVNALIKLLMAIASAIAKLASIFINFIWGCIRGMMDTVLKPVYDAVKRFIDDVTQNFLKLLNPIIDGDPSNDNQFNVENLFGELLNLVFDNPLFFLLLVIAIITLPFIGLVSALTSMIVGFLKPIIIQAIAGAVSSFTNENGIVNIATSLISGNAFPLIEWIYKQIEPKISDYLTGGSKSPISSLISIGSFIFAFIKIISLVITKSKYNKVNEQIAKSRSIQEQLKGKNLKLFFQNSALSWAFAVISLIFSSISIGLLLTNADVAGAIFSFLGFGFAVVASAVASNSLNKQQETISKIKSESLKSKLSLIGQIFHGVAMVGFILAIISLLNLILWV